MNRNIIQRFPGQPILLLNPRYRHALFSLPRNLVFVRYFVFRWRGPLLRLRTTLIFSWTILPFKAWRDMPSTAPSIKRVYAETSAGLGFL